MRRALAECGIHTIPIRTPWRVGRVNVYLIDDEPLTLVDAGPLSADGLADLEAGLGEAGRHVEDLERIVLTHQHVDHSGLAGTLLERSGAELCGLESLAWWMATYPASLEREDNFAAAVLQRHGAGPQAAEARRHAEARDYGQAATVTRPLRDGDVLRFAERRLQVLHRPGHSPYDTLLLDPERGLLFGGDHLLHWASTPIMAPAPGGDPSRRPRSFRDYLHSLRATAELPVEVVLPGHGGVVRDPRNTVAERLSRYARTTERIALAVTDEPRTAAAIAAAAGRRLREHSAFFVLCEILGHLDELIDAGSVVEEQHPDGLARFATA